MSHGSDQPDQFAQVEISNLALTAYLTKVFNDPNLPLCRKTPELVLPNQMPTSNQSLPFELLSHVFTFAAALYDPSEQGEINRTLLPALLGTCGLWRAVALATPCLWGIVDFRCHQIGHGFRVSSWDELATHLTLSRSGSLYLKVQVHLLLSKAEIGDEEDQYNLLPQLNGIMEQFRKLIAPHSQRFRQLVITDGECMPYPALKDRARYRRLWSHIVRARDQCCPQWELSTYAVPEVKFVFGLGGLPYSVEAPIKDIPSTHPLLSITSLDLTLYRYCDFTSSFVYPLKQLRRLRLIWVESFKTHPTCLEFPSLECLSFIVPTDQFGDTMLRLDTPFLQHLQIADRYCIRLYSSPTRENNLDEHSGTIAGPQPDLGTDLPDLPHLQTLQILRMPSQNQKLLTRFVTKCAPSLRTLSIPIMFPQDSYDSNWNALKLSRAISAWVDKSSINSVQGKDLVLRIVCLPQKDIHPPSKDSRHYKGHIKYIQSLIEIERTTPQLRVELVVSSKEHLRWSVFAFCEDLVSSVKDRWVFLDEDKEDLFSEWFDTNRVKGL